VKQGISNIWLLGMIVVFIAMFSAYIITTINYSKSFKMKNEMLTIIEKHHGMTSNLGTKVSQSPFLTSIGKNAPEGGNGITVDLGAVQTINLYLRGMAYSTLGRCPNNNDPNTDYPGHWYGVTSLAEDEHLYQISEEVTTNEKKYYWCFAKYDAQLRTGKYTSAYYKVRIFYGFDLPVLSTFLAVKVDGMTDEIFDLQDTTNKVSIAANAVVTSSDDYDDISK
jgi:hypothetical protein